jgi:hypothetical protein
MDDDLLTLPPQRDMPPEDLARRTKHLVSEARSVLAAESSFQPTGRRRIPRRRVLQVAIAAALAFAVVASVPALGVVQHVKSWLSGLHGPDEPVPAAPDVVIASGVAGVSWRIVATPTDQGLCLFLVIEEAEENAGLGGCGWGFDISGSQSATGALHWVAGGNGSGHMAALNRIITWGVAAEGVASVDLELTNGETVPANLVVRPEGIDALLNFYWAALGPQDGVVLMPNGGAAEPAEPLVTAIIARDPMGNVLERRVVSDPKS